MASKRKQEKLQQLLALAQLSRLLGEPGVQAAELASREKGQNIQAMLAMLGLQQSDQNADADRALRGEQFQTETGLRKEESVKADTRFEKEYGFREGRAKVEDTRAEEAAQMARENASVSQFLAEAGLKQQKELGEAQIGATKEGNTLDILRTLIGLPGADVPTLLKGAPNDALKAAGLNMEESNIKAQVDKARPAVKGITEYDVRNTFANTLPPEVWSRLRAEGVPLLPGATDFTPDFLPASMSVGQPQVQPQAQDRKSVV